MFGLDDIAMSGLGSLAGGLFGKFFGNQGINPYGEQSKYLDQIPGMAQKAYDPYINAGQQLMGKQNDIYSQMMSDPNAFFNKIGAGYKESPGYQKSLQEALGGITNASAAGGMAGSPMHQQLSGEKAAELASGDFQQYINNILGIQGTGLQGGENTMNRGFNATQGLTGMLGSNLAQQGLNAANSANWQNQNDRQDWGNIFSGAAGIMPWLFGGK